MLTRDQLAAAERLARSLDLDPNTFEPMYRPGYEPWRKRRQLREDPTPVQEPVNPIDPTHKADSDPTND